MKRESYDYTNYTVDWCSCYNHQRTGELGNNGAGEDYPSYSIIEIGQNTEKSPGNLRCAVTQTPVKNHHLTRMRKTQGVK